MLPSNIENTAARLGNEYAWRRADIPDAIRALEAAGLAIIGGEAWVVRRRCECASNEASSKLDNLDPDKCRSGFVLADPGDWVIYGILPTRAGGPLACFTWDVQARRPDEPWQVFVARSAAETLAWIEATNVEGLVMPHLARFVFYNVVFASETDGAEA
jgi:hypothetical protein